MIFRPHWFKPLSNWSKNNAEPSLIQNDVKFQCSVFIFLSRGFHAFVLKKFALSLLSTLSCPYLKLISISNDSLTFQSKYLFFMERVWGVTIQIGSGISLCIPWHSGCSRGWPVTFDTFLLVLYWSINDFLFCFTIIYWPAWTHSHNPRELFGINLSMFLHQIFFKVGSVWNVTLNRNCCISFLIFGPIFGTQELVTLCFL